MGWAALRDSYAEAIAAHDEWIAESRSLDRVIRSRKLSEWISEQREALGEYFGESEGEPDKEVGIPETG